MPTYSEWLDSTRALYTTAMTNAYANRNNADTTNVYYRAWSLMTATGDLASVLAPSSAFYGTPDGDEEDILLFQNWLQNNPVAAGLLGLEPTLTFRADQRGSLGNAGTIGGQKRRWKGNPVYTFANGVLIGKDDQIVAAIGTEGGEDLDGFGTDTIAYFDGIPFSTGTGIPGSVVFRGDTVVSGSIKGTGGVVIIDDVIQLETGVVDPAGIGVGADGKIRLRHRGEGFVDLLDEINTVQTNLDNSTNTAANLAKLWQGVQNTSSARWGTTLIPNGNMSLKTVDASDGYSDRLVGVKSVGTTSNIVSIPADGVGRFDASLGGIAFQAVPVESERYAIRIRYKGGAQEQADNPAADEGLFVAFHETADEPEDMGDKTFVYDTGASTGALYEGSDDPPNSDFYITNVTSKFVDNLITTDAGGNEDGATIQQTYQVKSFLYTPTPGTKSASLIVYTRNYTDNIDIDYVVMTEQPLTTAEVDGLITVAVDDIDLEVDDPDISVIIDPQMTEHTKWAGYNGATLENSTDGITGGDKAITVTITDPAGGGIVSSAIACETDRYLVGTKVRVLSSSTDAPVISMFAIENPNTAYSFLGNGYTTPLQLIGDNERNNIQIVEVDSSGNPIGSPSSGQTVAIANTEADGVTPKYTTLVGTYEVTVAHLDGTGTDTGSYDATVATTPTYPSMFSLVVHADKPCVLSVDYVYGRIQGASVNIAQSLADTAYSDAHGFVTAMNEQLIKESGSIIMNASMAILDSNDLPSGWRTDIASGTLSLDTAGDNAIRIVQGDKTGTRRLITPAFSLGTADQFSVGVRIRGLNGGINATVKAAVCSDSVLPSGYVTIAGSDGGNTDVLVADTVTTTVTETTITTGAITEDRPLYHENLLTTWDRGQSSAGGLGSIIVEADDDFEVDFVFVKEQTVSFDLADTQAQARRDEAIQSAAEFVSNIGDSIAEETGSFITNAGFSSWYLDVDADKQRPQKWLATRETSDVVRVITQTEVAITSPLSTVGNALARETLVTDKNINGSAIRFDPGPSGGGILSGKFQLPVGSTWENPDTGAVATTTGSYTMSVRIRLENSEGETGLVGVRLYAHEYFSLPTGSEAHVFCEDGAYGTSTLEGLDRSSTGTPLDELKLFTATDPEDGTYDWGQVQRIKLINVATNDASVGYNPDDGTGNSADEYVEYLPHDNGEDDGDRDALYTQGIDKWYDISGTYKPHNDTKVVSFEILIENDAGTTPLIYVDYVSLITQPFDSDFAQTLADARAESITGITSSGFSGSSDQNGGVNTTLAAAILANQSRLYNLDVALSAEDESTTLIPNSFFTDYDNSTKVPGQWLPTRNTDGSLTVETDVPTQVTAESYGTYVTLGGSDTTRGILSQAIPIIGSGDDTLGITTGGLTSNPNFDIAIRYRSVNPVVSQGSYTYYFLQAALQTVGTVNVTSSTANLSLYYDPPSIYLTDPSLTGTLSNQSTYHIVVNPNSSVGYDITVDEAEFWNDEGLTPASSLVLFRLGITGTYDSPAEISFTGSSSGYARVWDATSGAIVFEESFTTSNGPITLTGMSSGNAYWVQVFGMKNTFVLDNQSSATFHIRHWVNHYFMSGDGMNPAMDLYSSNEPISLSIIAHEYYDTSNTYDSSTTQYVYANGATLVHPSSYDSVVQRYNTGAAGATKNLDAILKADGDGTYTAVGTTTQTTSNIWKTLVALYKPFELNEVLDTRPRWVSFEFLVDGDPENDNIVPEIYIDGILLQASTETPLLSTIKSTAETAATEAGQALTNAGLAQDKADANEITIGEHTTSLENIELAQTEAAIVRTGIASEQGSILYNAGFSETITSGNLAHPLGFFPFELTPGIIRITNEQSPVDNGGNPTGIADFTTQGDQSYSTEVFSSSSSIYLDVEQSGSALAVLTTDRATPYSGGFYTRCMPLPKVTAPVIDTTTGTESDQDDRGNYSIAIKVRSAQTTGVSVTIKALEYDSNIDSENYIRAALDVTYGLYGVKPDWNYEPSTAPVTADRTIDLIGNQIDENDLTATEWEVVGSSGWTTVAGTYTPTSTAEFVSFAIFFTTDVNDEVQDTSGDAPDGTLFWSTYNFSDGGGDRDVRSLAYVDYILVTPATVSANLAADIAAGKAYEVQQSLEDDLNNLDLNLGSESDSLMPNGNFLQTFTAGSYEYVKNWVPTGTNLPSVLSSISGQPALRLYTTPAQQSIGTYVILANNADNNTSGIISKAILNPAQAVLDADGNINNYNLGLRIRGHVDYSTSSSTTWTDAPAGHQLMAGTWDNEAGKAQYEKDWQNLAGGPIMDLAAPPGSPFSPKTVRITQTANINGSGGVPSLFRVFSKAGPNLYFPLPSGNDVYSIVILIPFVNTMSDTNRSLSLEIDDGSGTKLETNTYSSFVSTNQGNTWTNVRSEKSSVIHSTFYCDIDNQYYNNTSSEFAWAAWVLESGASPFGSTGNSGDWERATIAVVGDDEGDTGVMKYAIFRSFRYASSTTSEAFDPSFSLKIVAHESFEGIADANVYVNEDGGSEGLTVGDAYSDVGITKDSFTNGQSTPLNLIDLRYSASTPGTEITIDSQLVSSGDDVGESIQDWRNIVGSYTPHPDTTAVSFELIVDSDPDGDGTLQTVWLDSVTMAAASINSDLATTIAENRVFVEQRFSGGESILDPNSVVFNGDFTIPTVLDVGTNSTPTQFPAGWTFLMDDETQNYNADTGWGYDDSEGTATNRVIFFTVPTTFHTTGVFGGLYSKPFRITHQKYAVRIRYKLEGFAYQTLRDESDNGHVSTDFGSTQAASNESQPGARGIVSFQFTHQTPSEAARAIVDTRPESSTFPTGNLISTGGDYGFTHSFGSKNVFMTYPPSDETVYSTLEFEMQMPTFIPGKDVPKYASMGFTVVDLLSNPVAGTQKVYVQEIECVPTGQPINQSPGGRASASHVNTTIYDSDTDPAPDVPRETTPTSPTMSSIDMSLSDSTRDSGIKDAIVIGMGRKYFDHESDLNGPDGTANVTGNSYTYPGASDLKYRQGTQWSADTEDDDGTLFTSPDVRTLQFPLNKHTFIENVSTITMGYSGLSFETTPGDGNLRYGDGSGGAKTYTHGAEIRYKGQYGHSYQGAVDSTDAPRNALHIQFTPANAQRTASDLENIPNWSEVTLDLLTLGKQATDRMAYSFSEAAPDRWGGFLIQRFDQPLVDMDIAANGVDPFNVTLALDSAALITLDTQDRYSQAGWSDTSEQKKYAQTRLYFKVSNNAADSANKIKAQNDQSGVGESYLTSDASVASLNFTGTHRCLGDETTDTLETSTSKGLIFVSTGKYMSLDGDTKPLMSEALPIVKLATKRNDKACFGVAIGRERREHTQRSFCVGGNFGTDYPKPEGESRFEINAVGEGSVWVCNINGNLENGDYITTCEIPGYGMLQDDDLLHNYTVAKITQDCTFELDNPFYDCVEFEFEGNTYRKAFVGCTYHCG